MKYKNDGSVIYTAFETDAIYLHNRVNGENNELIRVTAKHKPEGFFERIADKISPAINYRFIVADEKEQVLSDPKNYIIEMHEPGVAHVCFMDDQYTFIHSGIDATLPPPRENYFSTTDYNGIMLNPVSDNKLMRSVQTIGMLILPEQELQIGPGVPFDASIEQ